MFSKIARFRSFDLRRVAPPSIRAGHSSNKPSNDNRPGFRRPIVQRRIPHPGLVCHWTPTEGSDRLVCLWRVEDHAAASANEPNQSFTSCCLLDPLYRAAG